MTLTKKEMKPGDPIRGFVNQLGRVSELKTIFGKLSVYRITYPDNSSSSGAYVSEYEWKNGAWDLKEKN